MHARRLRDERVVFGRPPLSHAAFRPSSGAHCAVTGTRARGARLVRRRWIDGVGSPTGLCRP
ncbi:hypothetical protein [Kitasatospora sp. NPDC058218]|uniref:hypothetical protein n=1 Tax=Kitasatospora sp. NPDC058218 TaxID=3346385 RepID=UPI0036DBC641